MSKRSNLKNIEKTNISPLHPPKNDTIGVNNQYEEYTMPQEIYTKNEIDLKLEKLNSDMQHGFEKVDLKFDSLEQKFDLKFDSLEQKFDLKFDSLEQKIELKSNSLEQKMVMGFENTNLRLEKILLEFKEESRKEQESNKKWLIGISISIAGLILSIIINFFLKK